MKNIPQNEFENQVASLVTGFIKEKLEVVMKEEIKNYLRIEHPQEGNSKNGYYQRDLATRYGKRPDPLLLENE